MTARHIALILFGTAALAGCASGATSTFDGTQQVASDQAPAGPPVAAPAQLRGGSATASFGRTTSIIVGTPPSSDIERSVNAAYTVPPGSFLTSFEGVIARGVGLGGYVVSSATQPDAGGRIVSGTVMLKVPAAKLADLLNGMPAGFVASSIDFSAVDHTAQFVDVNARLASAHAHLAALDALLAKATSIGDISTLEQEIEAVQTEIDTDQGQLNVLSASVELATATVRLSERGATVAPLTAPNPVSGGLGGGWDNAVRVTGAVLEGVVSALPVLILAVVGLLVWRRLSRTSLVRRRSASPE
jgi:hypothetical protein